MEVANDLLSDALGLMHVTGSLLLAETYTPPWGAVIPDHAELSRYFNAGRDVRVVPFHYVQRGEVDILGANGERKVIRTGDVLVCFGGVGHRISQGNPANLVPFAEHAGGKLSRIRPAGAAPEQGTALVCGGFFLSDTQINPLFASLPPFMHSRQSDLSPLDLSPTIAKLLAQEVRRRTDGSDYVLRRLLELLCLDSIRRYIDSSEEALPNWAMGIRDHQIGRALAVFHQDPGRPWSVASLSAEAHLSPSRFSARFAASFGESCMAYVAKWRINVARHLLRSTDRSIGEIALQVGYQNVPAFTRAFKRFLGTAPAAWRTQIMAAPAAP